MKKKLIAMLLSAAMCLSLAACGQKADTPDTTDPAEPSASASSCSMRRLTPRRRALLTR